jgi:hypothetical protein
LLIPKKEKRKKKERKKGTPPWKVNVGGHPARKDSSVMQNNKALLKEGKKSKKN